MRQTGCQSAVEAEVNILKKTVDPGRDLVACSDAAWSHVQEVAKECVSLTGELSLCPHSIEWH